MNFPYFISKRITESSDTSFASTISRLAVISISLGLSVMILAFFILGGFQKTIKDKVYDFKGHLEITKFDLGSSYNEKPISKNPALLSQLEAYDFVEHIQFFAHKPGMFRTEDEVEGVFFKGVSHNFDTIRFNQNLLEGRFVEFNDSTYSKEVVISKRLATKLQLKLDNDIIIYFVQNPPRFRKLKIVGLFDTGMEDIDETLVLGDLGLIQRLNNWPDSLIGGIEVFVDDESRIDEADQVLFDNLDAQLYVQKVSEKYREIFDWLGLLDQNLVVFLGLLLIVACFNIVTILLILIMERTNMVGIFQSLGASKGQIKWIFIYNGMRLIAKGLLFGNSIALIVAFVQDQYKIIPLDAANYYMHFVPIEWDVKSMILLNVLTFVVVSLALGIPTTVISRIKPIEALKFD